MIRLSIFCFLLALAVAQNGYDYNKPKRPFGSGTSSNRPGSPVSSIGTTTPFPIRPQNDDFGGPTTGYPTGLQNYPTSSQRPGYPRSSNSNGLTGPDSSLGNYPNGPGNYPGQSENNYPQTNLGSGNYPGQSDSSYPQGSRGPSSSFPGANYGNNGYFDDGQYEGGDYSAIPGEPEIDYPILSYIPQTNFECKAQPYPGYYADVESRCQVFHVCANNNTYDFLCPNGTIFSQEEFVCVWWNQFECYSAPGLYELNAKIYDYSIRGSSDFNEYNGFGERVPQDYPSSGSFQPNNYYPSTGPQGSGYKYPGSSGTQGNANSYPGSPGQQDSTTPFPGVTSSRGPSNYPSQGSSGRYPGSQSTSNNYPDQFQGPGSNPNESGPSSRTVTTNSGGSGYPSGRPNGPSFPGSSNGRKPQKPSREYLPPRNKRTKQSRHHRYW